MKEKKKTKKTDALKKLEAFRRRWDGYEDVYTPFGQLLVGDTLRPAFRAAIAVGYALQKKPHPVAIHAKRKQREIGRIGHVNDLRLALADLQAAFEIEGDTLEQKIKSLDLKGLPKWKKSAIAKLFQAYSLVEKDTSAADSQAFLLLGQAVWEYQQAEGDNVWERDIRKIWAACPA